jgi:hypothetical protein
VAEHSESCGKFVANEPVVEGRPTPNIVPTTLLVTASFDVVDGEEFQTFLFAASTRRILAPVVLQDSET